VAAFGWDAVVEATANFAKTPQDIDVTEGSNKVWAINDNAAGDSMFSFIDDTFDAGPSLASPADGATLLTNPVTGHAGDTAFSWSGLSKSNAYEMDVALDSGFKEMVIDGLAVASPAPTVVEVVGPNQAAGAPETYEFMPGTIYYWRVKATAPVASPWSEVRSFVYESLAEPFAISGPEVGATSVSVEPTLSWAVYKGAVLYELVISEDPSFEIPTLTTNVENNFFKAEGEDALKYSTTYYWRVRGHMFEPYVEGEGRGKHWVMDATEWTTGIFTTMAESEEGAAEGGTDVTVEAPDVTVEAPDVTVSPPAVTVEGGGGSAIPEYLLWIIVVIGAVLIIALIVLIVRTRRVV
jgi:hypothetical protein